MKKFLLFLSIIFLLAGCAKSPVSTEDPNSLAEAYPAVTPTEPTSSAFIPQVSGGSAPEPYPASTESGEPTALPITSGTAKIYLVALDDNGASGPLIGCNDSLVPVEIMVDPGTDALWAALNALLGLKEQYYGQSGLYNALYQSNLQVKEIKFEAQQLKVELIGSVMLGGACDNPRFSAQLTGTVAQFAEGREVKIEINDLDLADVVSLK